MNLNFKTTMNKILNHIHINKIILFFVLSIPLLFTACEKNVFFDVDTKENLLVVNSIIQPDSIAIVRVTLSVDPLAIDYEFTPVEDATISIYRNELFAGDLANDGDGNYSIAPGILNAQPGDAMRMEVSAPGRTSVNATTTIPKLVSIESVEITDTIFENVSYSYIDSLGNYYTIDTIVPHYELQIKFHDLPGEDFYSLEIRYEDAYSEVGACFTTDDPVFTIDGSYGFDPGDADNNVTICGEVYFTDATFDNSEKIMTVSVLEISTEFITDPKLIFRLDHISKDYYSYNASLQLQVQNNDNPFSEPVPVFSNIVNGFGIFGGLSSSSVELEL